MTRGQRARLWDEINRYAVSCGGNPSQYVYGNKPRQAAVAMIEGIIREIEAEWANDLRKAVEADR
jgi:hypothetical protein